MHVFLRTLNCRYEEKLKRSELKRKEVQKEAEYLHEELMNCLVVNEKYAYEIRDLHSRLNVLKGSATISEEALTNARDEALAITHSKMVSAMEATVQKMQNNENRLIFQLESLRTELERSKIDVLNEDNEELNRLRKEVGRLKKEKEASHVFISNADIDEDFAAREVFYKNQISKLADELAIWKKGSGRSFESAARPQSAGLHLKDDSVEVLREKLDAAHQRLQSYKQLVKEKFEMVEDLLKQHEQGGGAKEIDKLKRELKVAESMVASRSNEVLLLQQRIESICEQFKNEKEHYIFMMNSLNGEFLKAVQHIAALELILIQSEFEIPARPSFGELTDILALANLGHNQDPKSLDEV